MIRLLDFKQFGLSLLLSPLSDLLASPTPSFPPLFPMNLAPGQCCLLAFTEDKLVVMHFIFVLL